MQTKVITLIQTRHIDEVVVQAAVAEVGVATVVGDTGVPRAYLLFRRFCLEFFIFMPWNIFFEKDNLI